MKSTVRIELDFPALVKSHHTMIWRYLRLLGCESALAEDLTQEVFLSVFQKPFEQISHESTKSYLRLVARHKFLDCLRRLHRQQEWDLEQAEQIWLEMEERDDGGVWRNSLRECLDTLDGRPLNVLHLRYRDRLPIRKVAESLGMKESGVKTLLGRLKARLRECVERKVNQS